MITVEEDIIDIVISMDDERNNITVEYVIKALIGSNGELESIRDAIRRRDRRDYEHHMMEFIREKVQFDSEIPDKTVGYSVIIRCPYSQSLVPAILLRSRVYQDNLNGENQ